jgi:pimeloyl-ACP methyl ester carboxylesterase
MLLTVLAALGAMAAAGALYQWVGTRRDRTAVPPPGRLVALNGRRVHAHAMGEGLPAVVFESGLAASSLNWRAVQEEVSRFTRAYCYDRAGYGWSDPARGPATAEAACADLHALLRALPVEAPTVLVGHSFGSYVLQLYACRHPDEVAGMVLVDPVTHDDWRDPGPRERRMLQGGQLFSVVGALLASVGLVRGLLNRLARGSASSGRVVLRLFGPTATEVVTRIVGEVGKMPPGVWPGVRAHWSRAGSFLTLRRYLARMPESARQVEQALSQAPPWPFPLIVLSAGANVADAARHRELASRSTRGRAVVVGGVGHWVQLDAPSAVVDAIEQVVREIRSGPPGLR